MRIALFTLDSALSAGAVRDLATALAGQLVLVGRSDPFRPAAGGALGQLATHWRRSGPRLLPFLLANYALPQALGQLRRRLGLGGLARLARAHAIPLHSVTDVNGPAMAEALRAARPDLIVSFHFDQIFSAATLALAPLGGINLHPALLPRHRGPLPAFWAMLEQPPAWGATVHRLVPRIDAGAILAQSAVALPPGTTASTATRRLHAAGVALCHGVIERLARGEGFEEAPPPPALPYCPFPPASLLRLAARRRLRLLGMADVWAALRAPTG